MNGRDSCLRISNAYYNLGLERAKARNLSGAAESLKRALRFNKNQTDARNLLGLVYFEIGEVSDALIQWVISLNLQPDNNKAEIYLDDIRRKSGRIDTYRQLISRYNQALSYAQSGNDDLAILQLERTVKENPDYVRANLLLALILMSREEYGKAGKYLSNVLKTDSGNQQAIWYMSIVRKHPAVGLKKGKDRSSPQTDKNAGRTPEKEDVIIPSSYRENTGWQTMLNIGMGILIGAAAVLFLYMPEKTAGLNASHNKDLISVESKLNDVNGEVDALTSQNAAQTTEINDLTNQLNTIEEANTYKLTQYQKLIGILDDYRNENYSHAADLFASIDTSQLTDIDDGSGVAVTDIYNSISGKMNAEGYASLAAEGDKAYDAGDFQSAISYYDKSLAIKPDYGNAMFKKAMSYKMQGDIQNANNLFGEVIMKFPNTEEAAQAKTERGY